MSKLIVNIEKAWKEAFAECVPAIKLLIENQVVNDLNSNRKANGSEQPKKKDSTKTAYAKDGYDTENWLIRSGDSTKLKWKIGKYSITVQPKGQEILGYHIDDAKDWFKLSDDTIKKIMSIIKKKFNEKLK